jgi:glucose-1-phosphate adenylyltransferase
MTTIIKKTETVVAGSTTSTTPVDMSRVASIILGGGQGTRLFPLTHTRCKPAMPFGGRYRLIDVPISCSINSDIEKIFVVTQFLSTSLHRHVLGTYRFDRFSSAFVELLTAEQRPESAMWFKGTADAIRQNLPNFTEVPADYFLILSGDQIYNIDFQDMMQTALATDAPLLVATLPVDSSDAKRMGIMQTDAQGKITHFVEKPKEDEALVPLRQPGPKEQYLASMGIYLFKREALFELLKEDLRDDFGKHLIPTMVESQKASAYRYDGYWEDIGTVKSFHEANLALTDENPAFHWYDESKAIYSQGENLPGPKLGNTSVNHAIISQGCRIKADEITRSVLGTRTVIGTGTIVRNSYLMGNDFYHPPTRENNKLPAELTIGENCLITNAIVDRNVHIGNNVQLINKENLTHYNSDQIYIRDGIIVVVRGADIPDHFVL